MNALIKILTKSGLLREDLDYHPIRASMVIVFLFFGYQKWFDYEAQVLIDLSPLFPPGESDPKRTKGRAANSPSPPPQSETARSERAILE